MVLLLITDQAYLVTFSVLLLHFHTAPVTAQSSSLSPVFLSRAASGTSPSCSLTSERVASSSAHYWKYKDHLASRLHSFLLHQHWQKYWCKKNYLEYGRGTVLLQLCIISLESSHQMLHHALWLDQLLIGWLCILCVWVSVCVCVCAIHTKCPKHINFQSHLWSTFLQCPHNWYEYIHIVSSQQLAKQRHSPSLKQSLQTMTKKSLEYQFWRHDCLIKHTILLLLLFEQLHRPRAALRATSSSDCWPVMGLPGRPGFTIRFTYIGCT